VSAEYGAPLQDLTRIRGVAGAMAVSADDGLIVSDSLMEGVPGEAVAALAASLTRRMRTAVDAAGYASQTFLHLQAASGALLMVPAGPEILLIVIGTRDLNVGLTRIEMLQVAERLG